ncbi:MAG: hypothetical protein K2M87_06530 [Muribaculaceae bacterium]|nr:hypothetical protein [Muribaculaceae bacterium]
MTKSLLLFAGSCLAAGTMLTSCIDDKYDLSNADTTTRLEIKDLTIPVNIDPVTLGSVIKIDEGSKIQVVNIGGREFYALKETGSFNSESIDVAGVSAQATPISPVIETLDKLINPYSQKRKFPEIQASYKMVEMGNTFSYNAVSIDDAIVSIKSVSCDPFEFEITLNVTDNDRIIQRMSMTDMVIQAPAGLNAVPSIGKYESSTGIWTIPEIVVDDHFAKAKLTATGVNFDVAGAKILPDRTLDFHSQFIVKEGYVNILASRIAMPDQIVFNLSFTLDDFTLRTFTGEVKYDIEGVDIAPVQISDIPDFLQNKETNLDIANPQIYIGVNNPVADVPLTCTTSLRLEAERTGLPTLKYDSDIISIGSNYGVSGPYNFALSPDKDKNTVPAEFEQNLQNVAYPGLGQLLTTPANWTEHGLPDRIKIELLNPQVPVQPVNDFAVPCTFSSVDGRYELLAPLALNDGSKIIYTDTRTGWADDDLDKMTITRLELTADAINNTPLSATLQVEALDTEGRSIAKIESNKLTAGAGQSQLLTFVLTGEIRNLDGIRFITVLEGADPNTNLSPEQTVQLANIRAVVSGYYQKKF